jgi:hypothetical protein
MWSDYYYNQNELVKIKFNNGIENSNDFNIFLNKWKELYEKKKHFSFIFDTINTSLVNPYYCYLMANFISELKKNDIQYLNYSVIIVKNSAIRILLNIIFGIQKPVAPVFLIDNNIQNKLLINDIINTISNTELKSILENNRERFTIINI